MLYAADCDLQLLLVFLCSHRTCY